MTRMVARTAFAALALAHVLRAGDGSSGRPLDSVEMPEVADKDAFPGNLPVGEYMLVEFRRSGCRMCNAFERIANELKRQIDADRAEALPPTGSASDEAHLPADTDAHAEFECVHGECTPHQGVIPDGESASPSSGLQAFHCVNEECLPLPGTIVADPHCEDGHESSSSALATDDAGRAFEAGAKSTLAVGRYSPEDWAAGAPGRFRGMSMAQFTCSPTDNICYDLGLRTLPTLRLYYGADLVAERVGAAKLAVVLEWLAAAFEDHERVIL